MTHISLHVQMDAFNDHIIWNMKQLNAKNNTFTQDPYKTLFLGLLSPKEVIRNRTWQMYFRMRKAPGGTGRIKRTRRILIKQVNSLGKRPGYPYCHIHECPTNSGENSIICTPCSPYFEFTLYATMKMFGYHLRRLYADLFG